MWPFAKKPIWQLIKRTFLRSELSPSYGPGGEGTDVDTFHIWACEYRDVLTGKTKIQEEYELY
jgi:hypothetical protein